MATSQQNRKIILCLNSGSSSIKFALYRMEGTREELCAEGAVESIALPECRLWLKLPGREAQTAESRRFSSHEQATSAVFDVLNEMRLPAPAAVGHRLVHGGARFSAPLQVDDALLAQLHRLEDLAPLHMPSALRTVEAVRIHFPGLPQVVCFDTAFHRRMPESAQRYPLPERFWRAGVRRYGFHGLSYEYIMNALGEAAQGRVIIAHLGNGASLAAVCDGQPQDTTMGFSPTGGLMMGTRSGDLDPGVLLHLMQHEGLDAAALNELVNHQAGLLGVSGITSDMKTLHELYGSEPRAVRAVEMFCDQVRKHIGALAAVLGGLDTLVFTGGIGERAAMVRLKVCEGLDFLGLRLDGERNERGADPITTPDSPTAARVIPTNEDLMIARHTRALIFPPPGSRKRKTQ